MEKFGATNLMIIGLLVIAVVTCWILFGASDVDHDDVIKVDTSKELVK